MTYLDRMTAVAAPMRRMLAAISDTGIDGLGEAVTDLGHYTPSIAALPLQQGFQLGEVVPDRIPAQP